MYISFPGGILYYLSRIHICSTIIYTIYKYTFEFLFNERYIVKDFPMLTLLAPGGGVESTQRFLKQQLLKKSSP